MKLIKNLALLLIVIVFVADLKAQDENNSKLNYGINLQVYPAGIIPTVSIENPISENSSIIYRLGANIVDRQDFSSENDTEEGRGFGAGAGYRKYFTLGKGQMSAGFNTDIWNLWIDWEDDLETNTPTSGTTYVLVLQPWLEVGYFLPINKKKSSQLGLTLGLGREINVITDGDDVEQDWIGSLSLQYKFKL